MPRHALLTILIAIVALACLVAPAAAKVVEVTAWVPVQEAKDADQLRAAVKAAVDEALSNAISFTPTLVALTNAQVIGERLYLRILLADDEGQRMLEDLEEVGKGEAKVKA